MEKVLSVLIICVLMVCVACKKEATLAEGGPKKIKVILSSGITVREDSKVEPVGKGPKVGSVFKNYEYKVLDTFPLKYKIELPDGKQGWVSANPAGNWTKVENNKVTILHPQALVVRATEDNKSENIGSAHNSYSYPLLKTEYSHFKIELPDGKSGWIYAGKIDEPWVEIVE